MSKINIYTTRVAKWFLMCATALIVLFSPLCSTKSIAADSDTSSAVETASANSVEADDNTKMMITVVLGGGLIIIIAVVVSVVSSTVSSIAGAVDDDDAE